MSCRVIAWRALAAIRALPNTIILNRNYSRKEQRLPSANNTCRLIGVRCLVSTSYNSIYSPPAVLTFTARRSKPELVVPARATPRESKPLSDVDSLPDLRVYTTSVEFFRRRVSGLPERQAASSFMKTALAEALVYYYPFAGRLRELPGGNRLVVDCTADGTVFVEAEADVRLEEFGVPLVPPYPCIDELICDVGNHRAVIGKPLLYLQMTEFRCGGLALALTTCHSMVDGYGKAQLFKCIVDLARGQALPTILPSWERHLLISSIQAKTVSGDHDSTGMAEVVNTAKPTTHASIVRDRRVTRSFLFGPREIAALRSGVPARLRQTATMFELITAAIWRCRTAALACAPDEVVCVFFFSNIRGSWKRNPPLPSGFYGNAMFSTIARAAASELCGRPLAYAVDLVHEAKLRVTDEYVRSVLDLIARGEYQMDVDLNMPLLVSDLTRYGNDSMNLGWAERIGGGSSMAGDSIIKLFSFYMRCRNAKGEDCVLVPMVLPEPAMGRFISHIAALTKTNANISL